jgi:hypothetical protein
MITKKIVQLSLASMLGLPLFAVVGCQTSTPGVDRADMVRFDEVIDAPPATVSRASEAVLDDYKFPIDSATWTNVDGHITAHNAQNQVVDIAINQEGLNTSKLSVRYGDLGDEVMSQQIMAKIRDRATSTGATIMSHVHGDSN